MGKGVSVQLAISNIDPTAAASVVVIAYDQEGQVIQNFFEIQYISGATSLGDSPFELPPLGTRILISNESILVGGPDPAARFIWTEHGGFRTALELDLDAGKMYWSDYIRGNTLLRADLSGTNEEIVFTTGGSTVWEDFEVDNDHSRVGDYGFRFPDYVVGDGWSVQVVLGNLHPDRSASVAVEVYDPEGERVSEFFDSGNHFKLPARGSRTLKSAGGAIRRGWIAVQTDMASVSGLLTYRNAQTGIEVSVEPVELGNHFALFVEESSGIGPGLAISKPDPSSTIEFRIYGEDGINPLGEGLVGKLQPGRSNHPRVVRCGWNQYGVPPELSGNPAVAIRGWLFVRSDWDTIWEAGRIALIGSCDPGHWRGRDRRRRHAATVTFNDDDGDRCTASLTFDSTTSDTATSTCATT